MGEGVDLTKAVQAFRRILEDEVGPVDHVILFGSAARGTRGRDSDVDLLVVSPAFQGMKFYKRAAQARRLWRAPLPVDILCYTPDEFDRLRDQATLVRVAVREGTEIAAA